jgi:hypothetical protein
MALLATCMSASAYKESRERMGEAGYASTVIHHHMAELCMSLENRSGRERRHCKARIVDA